MAGVLVLKALYFEMPEEGGLEVKLKVNKPADLVVKQVRLRINGDGFWSAVSELVGKSIVSTVKLTLHPIVLGPDMLDSSQFKKGESSCDVHIHLGSLGKFKAKKKTLVKKMTAISQKGDPTFTLEMEYGEKGFKWKTEGLLIALPVTCGQIVRAAQGGYNYLDPPAPSQNATAPITPDTAPATEPVTRPVNEDQAVTPRKNSNPVTPLKDSNPITPLRESQSESKKRKSLRSFRDELSPMKESIMNFMAPAMEFPNMLKNTILHQTHEILHHNDEEITFACIICKKRIRMEDMDMHSKECSTYDENAKKSLHIADDLTLTCVICHLQIPMDILDSHSASCYANQDLKVDKSNIVGKRITEEEEEVNIPEETYKEVEEDPDVPSYHHEVSFKYDKFYGNDYDSESSEDSVRDLYYNRDNFSKLNKPKEETVDREEFDRNVETVVEEEEVIEKEYDSEEDRERAFSMLYEANFAKKENEQKASESQSKDKKGLVKKTKDKLNKENNKDPEKKIKKEKDADKKKEKKESESDSTKPKKRKKMKNLAKQLVHL